MVHYIRYMRWTNTSRCQMHYFHATTAANYQQQIHTTSSFVYWFMFHTHSDVQRRVINSNIYTPLKWKLIMDNTSNRWCCESYNSFQIAMFFIHYVHYVRRVQKIRFFFVNIKIICKENKLNHLPRTLSSLQINSKLSSHMKAESLLYLLYDFQMLVLLIFSCSLKCCYFLLSFAFLVLFPSIFLVSFLSYFIWSASAGILCMFFFKLI